MENFLRLHENTKNNITEVKSAIRNADLLSGYNPQAFERVVYLFQSIIKSMIEVGNNIIIENDLRSPLNTADVFISLAEHSVISPLIVPGLKRAALAMPKIRSYENTELLEIITECINDFSSCLYSFNKYFQSKASEA
jgi:hypothetical protein